MPSANTVMVPGRNADALARFSPSGACPIQTDRERRTASGVPQDRMGSLGERLGRGSLLACVESPCGISDFGSTLSASRSPPLQQTLFTRLRPIRKLELTRGEVRGRHHNLP